MIIIQHRCNIWFKRVSNGDIAQGNSQCVLICLPSSSHYAAVCKTVLLLSICFILSEVSAYFQLQSAHLSSVYLVVSFNLKATEAKPKKILWIPHVNLPSKHLDWSNGFEKIYKHLNGTFDFQPLTDRTFNRMYGRFWRHFQPIGLQKCNRL